jgi:hypothetical protein
MSDRQWGKRYQSIWQGVRDVGRFLKGAPSSILKGGTRKMPGPLFGGTIIAVNPCCIRK